MTTGADYGALVERAREAAISIRNDGTPAQVGLDEAECIAIASAIEALILERDEARTQAAMQHFGLKIANEDCETKDARIVELEAGLRPFTGYDVRAIYQEFDGYTLKVTYGDQQPMFADFDRARALLPMEASDDQG